VHRDDGDVHGEHQQAVRHEATLVDKTQIRVMTEP
jgi:hypothetical protein